MISPEAFRDCVLVSLEFNCPGNSKKTDMDDVDVDADKDSLRLSKELLKSPKLAAIRRVNSQFRKYLKSQCVPGNYFRSGCYLLRRDRVSEIYMRYNAARARLRDAVEDFLSDYPAEIESARGRLRGKFVEADYPTAEAFREAVSMGMGVVTCQAPEDIDPAVKADQAEMAEAVWRSTIEEVRTALRSGLQGFVNSAVDRLTPGEDGKRRGLTAKGYDRMMEFLTAFEQRDVTKDSGVQELVARARQLMSECDIKTTKTAAGDAMLAGLQAISNELGNIITPEVGGRMMELQETDCTSEDIQEERHAELVE